MKRLELDNVVFEYDPDAEYEGKKFISFKKITSFKNNKKYQNLTVKPEHWGRFRDWMVKVLEGEDESVPF